MKNLAFILLIISLLICSVPVFAEGSTITQKNVAEKSGSLQIFGSLPSVDIPSNSDFQNQVNDKINNVYNSHVNSAKKNSAKQIDFSYKEFKSGNQCYLAIYTTITTVSAKDYVTTINFDSNEHRFVVLEMIMGPNGTKMANNHVLSEIKKNPDYYSDFDGISATQDFYIESGNINLLFDETEIAPSSYGMVIISMKQSLIHEITISSNDYYNKSSYNIKMIPLRKICSDLGYEVGWNKNERSVTIKKGSFQTQLSTGENKYILDNGSSRELESAPENKNNQLYVPISFFETVLGASYSIDSNGNITFSQYN